MKFLPVPPLLIDFINEYTRFFLISHVDPDGDCIASSLALGSCLERMGKQVEYFNPGPFGRKEIQSFAKQFSQTLPNDTQHAAAIILDCSQPDRIFPLDRGIQSLPKAVIDHHSNGGDYGDIRFINSSSPSASLLVQQVIRALGMDIQPEEAELIFFAFATDTGFFSFLDGNNKEVFTLLAELSEAGVSPRRTYSKMVPSVSLESRKYLGTLLQRSEAHYGGRFLFTWAMYDEIKTLANEDRDSASLYEQLMNVHEAEILLVLWEKEAGTTVGNIRTKNYIDAGKLAATYGGGGHVRAAGFSTDMSVPAMFALFKEDIAKFF